jgi:thiol-disulfide isomerase/thioredoxin
MMRNFRRGLLGVVSMFVAAVAVADHILIRPFDADSMTTLRTQYAGKPFVLAFWSTTCEPCRKEMTLWRGLKLRYPRMPIVLVAADGPGEQAAVTAFLMRYNPGPVQHWMFADEFAERVRYSVDKSWRGEMPRTYFYDGTHTAEAYSGLLDRRVVELWFRQNTRRN